MFRKNKKPKKRNFFRKTQIRRYKSQTFKNPYFKKKKTGSFVAYALIGIFIGLLIAAFSYFFTSDVFKITSVRIEGTETVKPSQINEIVLGYVNEKKFLFLSKSNRFIFKEEDLKSRLRAEFSFESLDIARDKQTVVISIKERRSSFLWLSGERYFLIDREGVAIREIMKEEFDLLASPPAAEGPKREGEELPRAKGLIQFIDLTQTDVMIGEPVLDNVSVEKMLEFQKLLEEMGISVTRFDIDKTVGTWVVAQVADGYSILFDPVVDIEYQRNNLEAILRDSVKDVSALEYIDLRFGDHVYFK